MNPDAIADAVPEFTGPADDRLLTPAQWAKETKLSPHDLAGVMHRRWVGHELITYAAFTEAANEFLGAK